MHVSTQGKVAANEATTTQRTQGMDNGLAGQDGPPGEEAAGAEEAIRPLTPEAVEAQKEVENTELELVKHRKNLSMDELGELKDRGVSFEKHLHRFQLWVFGINGWLNGSYIKGALFAGSCIVVQAPTFEVALRLAREGLESTLDFAMEWFRLQPNENTLAAPVAEAFGRRGGDPNRPLQIDPKLDAMLRHRLGGERWRG